MVMDETKFKDRVVLAVKKGKLTPEEFGDSEEGWKNISLNFNVEKDMNPSNYEWLYPILSEVQVLSLRLHGTVPASTTTDFHPLLARLLSGCKKLKSLALEPDFIMKGSGRISEGKETLENLEQLEILQPECRTANQSMEHKEHTIRIPEIFSRLRNIKAYKNYCADFCMMEAVFLYVMWEAIVPSNRRHLRSHAFYSISNVFTNILPQVEELFPSLSFNFETPALKALQVDCCNLQLPSRIASFISYLDSRLPLEELDITCHYNDPEDNSLLSILLLSVARHGGSLKKLRLWTWLENLSDWIFLRQSSLQDLRLVDRRMEAEENEWIRQVMANLPKSIEKLYLRGALLKREQKEQKPLTEPLKIECFARLDPQLLTQLSILNAGGLVDNQVADFICKAFKMLRKLHLSDAETDDEGFTEIAGLKG